MLTQDKLVECMVRAFEIMREFDMTLSKKEVISLPVYNLLVGYLIGEKERASRPQILNE